MNSFLNVDIGRNLGVSGNSGAEDSVSICPLITPSPPTNALVNPLPESKDSEYNISQELAVRLNRVRDKEDGDTSSSTSSIEPPNTQLLNHRNNFFTTKDESQISEEANGSQPTTVQLTFRNPPEKYIFMSWNWPLIRKISMWTFLAALAAMVALVVGMIWTLPKTCNPEVEWYQGGVFYEIFPASYYDTNNGMTGDFRGIAKNADYIAALGVTAVRLNSIFESPKYPEDYNNISSLLTIAKSLGNLNDFKSMVKKLNNKNLTVILDLPVGNFVGSSLPDLRNRGNNKNDRNNSDNEPLIEYLRSNNEGKIEEALFFWTQNGVEGFYLKGLDEYVQDQNFANSLRRWRQIIGFNKIFIIAESVLNHADELTKNAILNNVNLIDVKLKIENGATAISQQIEKIDNGTLFLKPGRPWVHWSIGDESTKRLVNRLPHSNTTLGALLLHLMLPGTPSIFYGDEISLHQVNDPQKERQDLQHVHQLASMVWPNDKKIRTFSWIHGEKTPVNFDQIELITKMTALRRDSPSIYMNSVFKEGTNKANAEVKYSKGDLLAIQRWYPRRKSFVVISNLGVNKIEADLSTMLYKGEVVVGPRSDSPPGSVSFKNIALWPGESVVTVLQ